MVSKTTVMVTYLLTKTDARPQPAHLSVRFQAVSAALYGSGTAGGSFLLRGLRQCNLCLTHSELVRAGDDRSRTKGLLLHENSVCFRSCLDPLLSNQRRPGCRTRWWPMVRDQRR